MSVGPAGPTGQAGPADALAPVLAAPTPQVWSFIGDSVTAASWHTWGERGFVELFHERLRELGRTTDGVVNTAVSGWRVTDLAENLDAVCLRYRPDVVVIGVGLNGTKGLAHGVGAFGRAYRQLVTRIRLASDAVVVLATPNGTLPTGPEHVLAHLDAYAAEIRAVARDLAAPLVDHHAEWQATDPNTWYHWLGHGCHPNAYGHRAMARTMMRAFGVWSEDARSRRLTIP
ncbi:SGNH/GDSL hydrolase family protein [Occultella aeris]|uniref:GDSL-like Lipase/Acylhydrolase n=1 Tax=Occultella aeris TaxID=2761496 RepID=A0A7M4DFK5_9MICO|nr:SGNH/GDSL hydrolase family protein [Occultella aeris]VZO35698.1 GDSL-like Lipase/Acylhydrolase [Occultella aeris]